MGERADSGPLAPMLVVSAGIGALLFAGALADHSDIWWPGLIGGVAFALLAYFATSDLLARTRARLDAEAGAALNIYAEGVALITAILAIVVPPLVARRRRRPGVAAHGRAPAQGREVRRAAHPPVTPPKLVLTVIDGLKPSALERAVATGRAPTLKLLMERGMYVDECVAAFPSVTPVARRRSPPGRCRTATTSRR